MQDSGVKGKLKDKSDQKEKIGNKREKDSRYLCSVVEIHSFPHYRCY